MRFKNLVKPSSHLVFFTFTDNPPSYSCKGECNVTRSRCNCIPGCEDTKTCCWDYSTNCKGIACKLYLYVSGWGRGYRDVLLMT